MAFFIGLVVIYLILTLIGLFVFKDKLSDSKFKGRVAASVMFIFTGISHFTNTEAFLAITPDFIPATKEMIYLSGIFEILGAIGLQLPRFRKFSAWGLILLLLAVFPANINAAVNGILTEVAFGIGIWYLWVRLLFQPVFIWWVWWSSLKRES
ncbi:MAG: DoxX family membrane protein [Ignavibacteriae bacterium]|nr:DoxX family membrane protein [Ignavibacteriota bacterium]